MAEAETTRTAHWGSCSDDDCGTAMVIYPHPYAGHDLPDTEEWENSPFWIDCPVCGERSVEEFAEITRTLVWEVQRLRQVIAIRAEEDRIVEQIEQGYR